MIINNNLFHVYSAWLLFVFISFSLCCLFSDNMLMMIVVVAGGGVVGDGQPVVSNITIKRFKVKRVFYFEWWLKFNVKTDIIGF